MELLDAFRCLVPITTAVKHSDCVSLKLRTSHQTTVNDLGPVPFLIFSPTPCVTLHLGTELRGVVVEIFPLKWDPQIKKSITSLTATSAAL